MASGYTPPSNAERVGDMIISAPVSISMVLCTRVVRGLAAVMSTIMTARGPVACASQNLPATGEPGGTLAASPGTISRQVDGKQYYVNAHNGLSESSAPLRHIGNDEPAHSHYFITPTRCYSINLRRCAMASLVPFTLTLTVHEGARLTAVLDALGPHWNPADIYTGEAQAHRVLCAHLDPDPQASYDVLLAAGALPEIPEVQS